MLAHFSRCQELVIRGTSTVFLHVLAALPTSNDVRLKIHSRTIHFSTELFANLVHKVKFAVDGMRLAPLQTLLTKR